MNSASNNPPLLHGLRVLLAEDSPDNQLLMKILLSGAGAEIKIASDGQEAMEVALGNPFDVLLMDLQMPKMDGHKATQLLRKSGYSAPIVALTAHSMADERKRCISSGFTDFLSKPVRKDQLLTLLAKFLPANANQFPG